MNRLEPTRRAWRGFWFRDAHPVDLAIFRVLVGVHGFWIVSSRDFAAIARVPEEFLRFVPWTTRLRYLFFESGAPLEATIQGIALFALLMTTVGVFPRVFALVGAVTVYHLAPLEAVMWTSSAYARGLTLTPVALALLAFSRSGDALTIVPRAAVQSRSWQYRWPLRAVQVLVAQMYFFSALGKVLDTGWGWGSGENIRQNLLWAAARWINLGGNTDVLGSLTVWVADLPLLCVAIGIGTMVFEWTFPIALFSPRLATPFVVTAAAFHIGILCLMGIFVAEAWYLLAFVDWTGLAGRLRGPSPTVDTPSPARPDGD